MKYKNRILSMLLAVIMVVCMLPVSVFATETTKYWVSVTVSPFDGSGGTVSGEGEYAPGEQVTISIVPNTDSGYCAAQWGLSDIGGGVISAINQKTSHTFTMPENAVQISITFTQHSYITYSDLGDGTHQNKCFYCMTPNGEPEAHVDAHGGGDGTTPPDGYCDLCSVELHTHSYSSVWLMDASYHWRDCSCGGKFETAAHTSSGAASYGIPETCTVCGYEIASALSYYTVTFDAKSGNISPETAAAESGTTIAHMNATYIPIRAGYDFAGWSLADDGTADSSDTGITTDCILYAIWQQYSPSYDDDYYDPPPASIPVDVGGNYDAILRDDVVIIRGDDPISGTLDLTGTDAKAIQLPADALEASTEESHAVTIRFPDDTAATLTDSGLVAARDALCSGESLQIAVRPVDAEDLPETLTEQGPYGGSEAAIDKSIFKATGIDNIEDRLKTLGLINGNTDSSVTEDEFEYLYHYLTTDELMALRAELNESVHFEHHQKAVEWLDKMIERDATVVDMSNGQLNISGILSKLEAIGYTGGDFTLGFLRQADLDMEHLEYIRHLMQQFVDNFDDSADELVLAWAKDAIAQKELEASYEQMDEWIAGLSITDYGGEALDDAKLAAESMTTAELERFLENARETNMVASSLALGGLISFLEDELEARQAQDAPTYINTSGTNDGINPILIGAVDVNIGAVKADGTTTPIAIKADRSDAFVWSTNVSSAALEEMLAMLGAATTEDVVSNIKAYKVLDNGTLEARASKVTVNADGTLTLSAMSDGNSTYVFLYEPAKADVDDTPTSPKTGQQINLTELFALLIISGGLLAVAVKKTRKAI